MEEKIKPKKSGSAIFMYFIIAITIIISLSCFTLYYFNFYKNDVILWSGITAFTILYHFWLRIIMGNVNKLFKISYKQKWFKELPFEKNLYAFLRVKKWKDKALTYDPDSFSLQKHSLEEIANTMAKSEADHWVNEIISISTIFFSFIWGQLWIFLLTAILAMIFDFQIIIIQRFNRPNVVRLIEKQKVLRAKNDK